MLGKKFFLFLVIVSSTLAGGCSREDFTRIGYMLGTQYSCRQSNNYRPNEGVKDLECTNPVTEKGMSYEEYQKQRAELLKHQGED